MSLDITLALGRYEWTRGVWDGSEVPAEINLTTEEYHNPDRFDRMANDLAFDACELSMGTYLATRSNPESFPFTAIPVFPHRRFRHSYIYVRPDAGIAEPEDLEGKRVGIINWQMTTGIWQRGILRDRYGVDITKVEWQRVGSEIVPIDVPDEYPMSEIDSEDGTVPYMEALLRSEELDAVFHPVPVDVPNVERLFDDPIDEELAYFEATGIFPIMHAIVIKNELLESDPWIAQAMFDSFQAAKEDCLKRLERPQWIPLLWADIHAERQRKLLSDPWEYGLTEDNRMILETLLSYAERQGVASERYAISDVFFDDPIEY